jgi:putative radical SAM enzyme (TIGR03279 family)
MIRIASIEPESIAAELNLPVGLTVLEINGNPIQDTLDLIFYQAEERVLVTAEKLNGEPLILEIEKSPDETLGIIPEPDKIRRCTNACSFCFVKGNPKAAKLRDGLYIKDDDYRLSFLHGHYITLTNLRPNDWDRIFKQRLSPLYVSVHATQPDVRLAMLKNPRSALINEDLNRLGEEGIVVHAQVVLCPGVNDGATLLQTMENLYSRGEDIQTLSIVPVGLTTYNRDRGGRNLSRDECLLALDSIELIRERALDERGVGWCYAADELFLQAGLEPPGPDYFDDDDLEANGVGAISWISERVREGLDGLPPRPGERIVTVTGESMAKTLKRLSADIEIATGAKFQTVVLENSLYGPTVTSAGLLSGADHAKGLERAAPFDLALFSASALNEHDMFLDDLNLTELRSQFPDRRIEPSHDLIDTLINT